MPKPVSEIRVVATLSLLYVFRMLGLFMVFPVMMIFGQEYTGATPFLLGLALGGYGLTQALFQIPLGLMSDIFGRKPIILLGLLLFALGSVVAAMSESVWGLLIGRALQGSGAIASAVMAMVGDLTSEQNRTRAMAMIGVSIGLSFSLAMVLGPALAAFGGLSAIFWVSSILALVGIVILYALVPTPPRSHSPSYESLAIPSLFSAALKNPDLLRLNTGIFALHFILTATFVVVPMAFENAGLAVTQHWYYYLPIMVVAFLGMLPFIYIAERRRKLKTVFLATIGVLILAQVILGLADELWVWVLGLLVFFGAFNLLEATLPSLISKQSPAGGKGTAMGIYSTCQFLGTSLGGVVGGISYQWWGINSVFVVCGVVCLTWLVVAARMRPPRYLTSVCIPQTAPVEELALKTQVPGIVEAIWVKDQALLYLKVDDSHFKRSVLTSYLEQPSSG